MNTIKTAQVVVLSQDGKQTFLERNKRYEGKLTLFGGKVEDGEDSINAIIREIKEETGLEVTKDELIEFLSDDRLQVGDNLFIGTIYILILDQVRVRRLLDFKKENIGLPFEELVSSSFAFSDTIGKVQSAVDEILKKEA